MDASTVETLKVLGGGTMAAALLALIYIVGMRLVAAIDALVKRMQEHEESENEHHTAVKSEIAGLKGQIGGIMDAASRLTPAHGIKPPR